ncbi:WD40 repeat-like protein, partial [Hortaea werneckii]
KLAAQNLVPSSKADLIVNLNAPCYSGQFSEDGSFFFACGRDFKVRMYDTSNPYDWKYYKTVHYYGGQWTITDASLSPDNRNLAYSSIRSQVCLANTEQGDDSEPQMLDFSDLGRGGRGGGGWGRSHHFGIWSLRFSGDGGEIVAGTSDSSVYVYDLEAQRSILRIPGHQDDVNAVCFGDKMSPHILYSGSDDTTVKVWDRRSLASMRPAGMFLGHTEGVTYIDSKGDGRYVISNGKDQTCKLWDLRKMISTDVGERINPQDYTTNFDYRFSPYDTEDHVPHQHDCSLVTFRGHRVLKTLIRCHFSPPGSTDGRYIYSGSHDGKIYVWNLDGTQASEPINVLAATRNSRPADDERFVDRYDYYGRGGVWKTIVRDCSWHPSAPVIAATSWNGWDHGLGTATVHSWNDGLDSDEVGGDTDGFTGARAETMGKANSLGSTPMGARVTAQLNHDDRYYGEGNTTTRQSTRSRRMRARMMGLGGLFADDEDDDE